LVEVNIAIQPKILIYPSVGSGYGIGNLMRCITIHRFLSKNADSVFALDPSINIKNFYRKFIRVIAASDIEKTINRVDAVLFDHQGPLDSESNFKRYHELCPGVPIVALDYFYLDTKEVEVFINLTDYCETKFSGNPDQQYLNGLSFAVIRQEFSKKIAGNSQFQNRILITFGGEDSAGWTLTVSKWLEKIIKTPLKITVVLGNLNVQGDRIRQFVNGSVKHDYTILTQISNMEDHMHNCDIAFCGGGTTLLELAYLGKPVIALPQNKMEEMLILNSENEGFLIPDSQDSIRNLQPEPYSRLFNDSHYREKMGALGRRLVNGRGAEKIAKVILESAVSYQKRKRKV
jgi:spore coat polysaccharide biosynthesis predicted glycosyltransferase SpsG